MNELQELLDILEKDLVQHAQVVESYQLELDMNINLVEESKKVDEMIDSEKPMHFMEINSFLRTLIE